MTDWLIVLGSLVTFVALGSVTVAALWLRRLKAALAAAMNDSATSQLATSKRLAEAVLTLQRQNKQVEQQLQTLGEANLRLRQDFILLVQRIEREGEDLPTARNDRTVH